MGGEGLDFEECHYGRNIRTTIKILFPAEKKPILRFGPLDVTDVGLRVERQFEGSSKVQRITDMPEDRALKREARRCLTVARKTS